MRGIVVAVCISETTGTKKEPCPSGIFLTDYGLSGDAHAGFDTHRQVSLLSVDSIEKMKKLGIDVCYGDFAENLTIDGFELFSLPIGTRLTVAGRVVLEITQIGKKCHNKSCAIFRQVGKCIMPKEGVFARVIEGGKLQSGDVIEVK